MCACILLTMPASYDVRIYISRAPVDMTRERLASLANKYAIVVHHEILCRTSKCLQGSASI